MCLVDMDGTLYDSRIDFLGLRKQLSLPQDGRPILEQLQATSPETTARGIRLLHAAEAEAAANGQLIPGTREMLEWLQERKILCGLVTNNSRRSVDVILASHPLLSLDLVLTRDDGAAKPNPDLFLLAMERLDCKPSETAAVGDTHLDALGAHRAGIREIQLLSLPDWMARAIPRDIDYKPAGNLVEVQAGIARWLDRSKQSGS